MPTIEFKTYNNTAFELFRPVPASKMQPDWWKKSKVHTVDKGQVGISLRACPAMHDWLSTGYYIATNRDIHCIYRENDTAVVVGILGFCLTVKIMKILILRQHIVNTN